MCNYEIDEDRSRC